MSEANGLGTPHYEVTSSAEHDTTTARSCGLAPALWGRAGRSKKSAEARAADDAWGRRDA